MKKRIQPPGLYGTIGPICKDKESLKKMLASGMTGMVYDAKKYSYEKGKKYLDFFYQVSQELKIIPDLIVDDPDFIKNLTFYSRYPITGAFVRNPYRENYIVSVKHALLSAKLLKIKLFAVMEIAADVNFLPIILPHCEGVVIDRTLLRQNAESLSRVPALESEIAAKCRMAKTPFILSGEFLSSIAGNPQAENLQPSLSDVSDIFHGILQGASAFFITDTPCDKNIPNDNCFIYMEQAMQLLSDTMWEAMRYQRDQKFF